jgi:hypothetical protein
MANPGRRDGRAGEVGAESGTCLTRLSFSKPQGDGLRELAGPVVYLGTSSRGGRSDEGRGVR